MPRSTLELPVSIAAGAGASPEIVGDLLLVPLGPTGLAIYDVSDLSQPVEIATVSMAVLGGQAGPATTDGSRVYVDLAGLPELAVLDLTTPQPTKLGEFGSIEVTLDLALVGDTLMANAASSIDFLGGVYAFDTTTPIPSDAGNYLVDLVDPGFLALDSGVVLIARTPAGPFSAAGFDAIDFSVPSSSQYLGTWASATPGNITGMSKSGDRLFISAYWGGLWAVDVSDFSQMSFLDGFDFEFPESYALDVEASGSDVLLLQGGPPGFANQVNHYSISEDHSFTLLDTVPLGDFPGSIARGGQKVAVDEFVDLNDDGLTDHRLIRLFELTDALFADGFETGDTSAWDD